MLILIFIYVNLYADALDMYYINKALSKINYLSSVSKLSIQASNNDFLNNTNILTARNSRLVDMISKEFLSTREREILSVIDKIILNETSVSSRYSCVDIVRHNFSRNGEYINPSITAIECDNINIKFEHFYELGVNSIKNLHNTILDENRQRINLHNTLENNFYYVKKVKKLIYNRKQLEEKVKFLNDQELLNLSIKFADSSNQSIVNYRLVIQNIILRANELLRIGSGDVNILNNVITNCDNYIMNTYSIGESPFISIGVNQITEINKRIHIINSELITTIDDINTTQTKMEEDQATDQMYENMGRATDEEPRKSLLESLATALTTLTELQESRDSMQAELLMLQSYLDDPASIPEDSFSTFLISLIQNRIAENILYNTITKINLIQRNINKFILNNNNSIINQPDIIETAQTTTSYIDYQLMGTTEELWWPNMFDDESLKVTFTYDENNFVVRYSNIFSSTFISSLDSFNINVRNSFIHNIALNLDATIDNNFDLVLPLELNTIKFLGAKNNIPVNKRFNNVIGCSDNKEFYRPNQNGGFIFGKCTGITFNAIHVEDFDDINDTLRYRDTNISYGIFLNNIGGDMFYQTNGTSASKIITQGGNFMRIVK